jgi:hypothetical protein
VACQAASEIVPGWALPIAALLRMETLPKFASDRTRQFPEEVQTEGASWIHSADERSGLAAVSSFVKTVCRVRFLSWISTEDPFTFTDAVIVFPGATLSLTLIEGAGTSSYQAWYVAFPVRLQSADVPTCSSACEPALKPPRPTHVAENSDLPATQLARGCFQVPVTLVNAVEAVDPAGSDTAYPAQLVETSVGTSARVEIFAGAK